jgi:hypothetical protein
MRRWAFLALGALLLGAPTGALADPTGPSATEAATPVAGRVSVKVMMVHANNSGKVDGELQSLVRQLQFTKYNGFNLLQQFPAQLSVGQHSTVQLLGDRRLKVELLSRDATKAKLRIRMFKDTEKVLDTTVSVHRNRTFIIGGPKHKEGALILPVTVTY